MAREVRLAAGPRFEKKFDLQLLCTVFGGSPIARPSKQLSTATGRCNRNRGNTMHDCVDEFSGLITAHYLEYYAALREVVSARMHLAYRHDGRAPARI